MRLRNRIIKAEYYTDPDLLQWPRSKREFYRSLWGMAEDSYCIEDSPFGWKVTSWPSPLDTDMSIEAFETWRDELIADGKLVPYSKNGKRYLFLPDMARHEKPRNPQSPSIPLPDYVEWVGNASDLRKGTYKVSFNVVEGLNNNATTVPALPCPALPCPVLPLPGEDEFDEFYNIMPKHSSRDLAIEAWESITTSVSPADLITCAKRYAAAERDNDRRWLKTPHRFLLDGVYLDYMPKAPKRKRPKCTNPDCIDGLVLDESGTAHRCEVCNREGER